MKNSLISSFYVFMVLISIFPVFAKAQSCDCLSTCRDKKNGTRSTGGITSSINSFSLLINKETSYIDTTITPRYYIILHAVSPDVLNDSLLATRGTFELTLTDSSKIIETNVAYANNPIGIGPAIGFSTTISEEHIRLIAKHPIVRLTVPGILVTYFTKRSQENQRTIYNCLLNSKR